MAHPNRREWAENLAKELDCSVYYDTNNTIWDTCKGAWRLAPEDSDYHFVIQDDAILCKDFKKKVHDFVQKILKTTNGNYIAFQLYIGRDRLLRGETVINSAFEKGFFINNVSMWGVAIGMPTKYIDKMIQFGNGYPAWQDDTKIKYFLKSVNLKTAFPVPCLVDHRPISENKTLTPCVDFDKKSPYFIDNI